MDLLDLLLVMSVNPGFGGQAFIPQAVDQVRKAKALIGGRPIELQVDGGVTDRNAGELAKAGATVLVAGSAVFSAGNRAGYGERISAIRRAAS
jgi:ribulose-phosphate 3-epimerase